MYKRQQTISLELKLEQNIRWRWCGPVHAGIIIGLIGILYFVNQDFTVIVG